MIANGRTITVAEPGCYELLSHPHHTQAVLDLLNDVSARQPGGRVEATFSGLGRDHHVVAPTGERDDLFVMDVATGLSTRLTLNGTRGDLEWDPDSTRLLFS